MITIERTHLETWAGSHHANGEFPLLIAKLISATTPNLSELKISHGSAIYLPGWDGTVFSTTNTVYVLEGTSLWEFGTSDGSESKANKDYKKRTENPIGYKPSDCTFIFATPCFFSKKEEWIKERKNEGIWKDIKVYDSIDIASWLETTKAVKNWFGKRINIFLESGYIEIDQFWLECSKQNGISLEPEVFISGREVQKKEIKEFLLNPNSGDLAIKTASKYESLSFFVACIQSFESPLSKQLIAQIIILEDKNAFRDLIQSSLEKLILVCNFEDKSLIYSATVLGHKVIIPLGEDEEWNVQSTLLLPIIDADGQINSLIKSGIEEKLAKILSFESSRDITIIKNRLGFQSIYDSNWLNKINFKDLLPALLLNRWDESKVGDKELLETLSGKSYEEYRILLCEYAGKSNSPLINLHTEWRIKSPFSMWVEFSPKITSKDFEDLKGLFNNLFLGSPKTNEVGLWGFSEEYYSNTVRSGVVQNLILISYYGKELQFTPFIKSPVYWVDSLIKEFLEKADTTTWVNLSSVLRQIAEASPSAFIDRLEATMESEMDHIVGLFIEDKFGIFGPSSRHTDLLWALEGLTWLPDYFERAVMALAKLATIDPGGQVSNRPINSLKEIFKVWHYQTTAQIEIRKKVLGKVAEKFPIVAWPILISMINSGNVHDTAFNTHRFKWRSLDFNLNIDYTFEELFEMKIFSVEKLIEIFNNSSDHFNELIGSLANLDFVRRNLILNVLKSNTSLLNSEESVKVQNKLGELINKHRSCQGTYWALNEQDLLPLEELYHQLTPEGLLDRNEWLFSEFYPKILNPEPYKDDDGNKKPNSWEINADRIFDLRKNALITILANRNINELLLWTKEFPSSFQIGIILEGLIAEEIDQLQIFRLLDDNPNIALGFISEKTRIYTEEWVFEIYNKLLNEGLSKAGLSLLFTRLTPSLVLWQRIRSLDEEVYFAYWKQIDWLSFNKEDSNFINEAFREMLNNDRAELALKLAGHYEDIIELEILTDILLSPNLGDIQSLEQYSIQQIVRRIQDNFDEKFRDKITQIEWRYLPLLTQYKGIGSPKYLEEEMALNPIFFIEVLCTAFQPANQENHETNSETPDLAKAERAWKLLTKWKTIPGGNKNNEVDYEFLFSWITTARGLAKEKDREKIADAMIGNVFAQYPEPKNGEGLYPSKEICEVIQNLNSKSLFDNFSASLYNKRGSSSRAAFEGGDIERVKAEHFDILAKFAKEYPLIAKVYERLKDGYLEEAKIMDAQAASDKLNYQ